MDGPLISGIGWVSELIAVAGGDDIFAAKAKEQAAVNRIVRPDEVVAAAPDVILASWCGKKVVKDRSGSGPAGHGFPLSATTASSRSKSPLILQPGPAALTDGLDAIVAAIRASSPR